MVKITSDWSKSAQNNTLTFLHSRKVEQNTYCLYQLLRDFLQVQGPYKTPDEPFFIFSNESPVRPIHMRNSLKTALHLSGLDNGLHGVHSLCSRRAGELLCLGITVETIKKLGCWRSNAVFRYLR